jgi:hypothetical protein
MIPREEYLVSSENWFIMRWCSQTVELCWDLQDKIILGKCDKILDGYW